MTDPHARLIRDLIALTDGTAILRRARSQRWASVTFTGTQHFITLALPTGASAWLSERIGEIEFAIPDHIVIDITIDAKRVAGLMIELDLIALTIEDR